MRFLKAAVVCLALGLTTTTAWAEYPCLDLFSDPGSCFYDADNNTCFSAGDTTGITDDLEAGDFDAEVAFGGSGGIVCPPSVKKLIITADTVHWHAGGNIELYGQKVFSNTDLFVTAGGAGRFEDVNLRSSVDGGSIGLFPDGDLFFSGQAKVPHCDDAPSFESCPFPGPGDIGIGANVGTTTIGSKSKFDAGTVNFQGEGTVTLEDRVKVKQGCEVSAIGVQSDGANVVLTGVNFNAQGQIDIVADGAVTGLGYSKMKTVKDPTEQITILALTGDISFERLKAQAGQHISLAGGNIKLGPALDADAKSSMLQVKQEAGGTVDVFAGGSIDFERVKVQGNAITLDTSATTIEHRNGELKGKGSAGGTTTLNPAPPGICDLSGTRIRKSVVDDGDCGTLTQ